MPEGHTVHRVANLFTELFAGHTLHAWSPQGRFSEGAKQVSESRLVSATATGKQLFLAFDNDLSIRVHLGIYGAWDVHTLAGVSARAGSPRDASLGAPRRRLGEHESETDPDEPFPPEPRGQVRLRLETPDTVADLRGPTACEVLTPQEVDAVRSRLGPDPLVDRGRLGEEEFIARLTSTRRAVGLVLMDQSVVSGIGNVYRAEILFRHQLDPYLPSSSLDSDTARALWKDWKKLLREGVKTGVMMTRTDLTPAMKTKALRSSAHRYFVYGRAGQACRVCGTAISMDLMATRKLYYCPRCQVS